MYAHVKRPDCTAFVGRQAGCVSVCGLSLPLRDINCGNLDLEYCNGRGSWRMNPSAEKFQNVYLWKHGTFVFVHHWETSEEPQIGEGVSPAPCYIRGTWNPLEYHPCEWAVFSSHSHVVPCVGHRTRVTRRDQFFLSPKSFSSSRSFLWMFMGTHLARTHTRACCYFSC